MLTLLDFHQNLLPEIAATNGSIRTPRGQMPSYFVFVFGVISLHIFFPTKNSVETLLFFSFIFFCCIGVHGYLFKLQFQEAIQLPSQQVLNIMLYGEATLRPFWKSFMACLSSHSGDQYDQANLPRATSQSAHTEREYQRETKVRLYSPVIM